MSEIAHRDPPREDPVQTLIRGIRSPTFREQVKMALPETIPPERFVRVAVTALQTNPDLAGAEPDSIIRALIRCAQDGLLPDGRQAAIVRRKRDASYMPMIGGLYDRAMQYGWTLKAKAVYAADEFDYSDEPEWIKHRQARPNVDRGELVAAYATARHRDGSYRQAVLHPEDIAKRRAKATTQMVWNEWPAQMWEKSAAHDLYDQLGMAESAKAAPLVRDIVTGDPVAAMYGPRADRALLAPGDDQQAEPPQPPPAADSAAGAILGGNEGAPDPRIASAEAGSRPAPQSGTARTGRSAEPTPSPASPSEPAPPDFVAPAEADGDPVVVAARQAAQVVVPIGQWKGRTLAEVLEAGERGASWLGYALKNFDDSTGAGPNSEPRMRPGEFVEALRAFTRIYLPEVYQAAIAESELAT